MPDDSKTPADRAPEKPAPIDPKQVKVTVTPQQEKPPDKGSNRRKAQVRQGNEDKGKRAERATDAATKDVQKAVGEAAGKGREAQVAAADKAADVISKELHPGIFKDIQVEIPGEAKPIVKPASQGQSPAPPPEPSPAPPPRPSKSGKI